MVNLKYNFMRNYVLLTVLILALLSACSNRPDFEQDALEINLARAAHNRPELEQVLSHYSQKPEDSLKLKAAKVLIANLESQYHFSGGWLEAYDQIFQQIADLNVEGVKKVKDSIRSQIGKMDYNALDVQNELFSLKASFLIEHIDEAVKTWQNAPWHENISFEVFCNFILPYKNYQEYPELWRKKLHDRYYNMLRDSFHTLDLPRATTAFNSELADWFKFSSHMDDYPGRASPSNLFLGQRGNCQDMCNLATYVGRSLGIPVSIEYVPLWCAGDNGHSWNALILNDSTSVPFMGAEGHPDTYAKSILDHEGRRGKVYRKVLFKQENSFAQAAKGLGITQSDIPRFAYDLRYQDVTHLYSPVGSITVSNLDPSRKVVYLSVYNNSRWQALSGAVIRKDGTATFENMGVAITYLPVYFQDGAYIIASDARTFTFDADVRILAPSLDATQSIRMKRKSPNSRLITKWTYAVSLNDAELQGAHHPAFEHPTVLYKIDEAMEPWTISETAGIRYRDQASYSDFWEEVAFPPSQKFRYIRFKLQDDKPFKLGDLEVYDAQTGNKLEGKPIGTIPNPEHAFDGTDGYSIIHEEINPDAWVGLDLGSPRSINKFRFIPAQDKNRIFPGRQYQLYYWDKKWILLKKVKSEGFALEFDNVPTNALFLLHCLDCETTEERPFTVIDGLLEWW